MRLLVDSLYEVDDTGHCWSNPGKITFLGDMWKYCGKTPTDYKWEPEWLEEVEI